MAYQSTAPRFAFLRMFAAGGATRPKYFRPRRFHQAACGTVPLARTLSRAAQPRTCGSSQNSKAASGPELFPPEEKKSSDIISLKAARSLFHRSAEGSEERLPG